MPPREYYPVLGSSQDRAIALARAGAVRGTRVIVGLQTAGRGRRGDRWASPEGGLYVSIVLGDSAPAQGLLPLALGASVAEALVTLAPVPIRLKWPNDLVVIGPNEIAGKLGGILVDRLARPDGIEVDVAGVGLNGRRPAAGWSVDGSLPPVALDELTDPPALDALEEAVANALERGHDAMRTETGRRAALASCRRLLWGVGRKVRVDGELAGRLNGVADDGALELSGLHGPVEVRAGHVAIEEEPA